MTWDEYLKFEELYTGRRRELVRGQVRLMAGESERHDLLVQLLNAELLTAFRGTPCRVFVHNRKVRTAEDTGFYPDVLVRCGAAAHALYETDARFVVEVLSPSSDPADLTERLYAYQGLPSAETIAFVDHRRRVVTVHERVAGIWTERHQRDGVLRLGRAAPDLGALWAELDAEATTD